MSDPALKRQLAEALLKIKQLEQAAPKEAVKTVIEYRDVPYRVEVPIIEYRDREVVREIPGPTKIQIEYVDREVVRVETKIETEVVEKKVFVPVEVIREVVKEVYVDNPEHIKTIALLQEKLCQSISA